MARAGGCLPPCGALCLFNTETAAGFRFSWQYKFVKLENLRREIWVRGRHKRHETTKNRHPKTWNAAFHDAKACLLATETWPFAVEKTVFYTAICGILHYLMPPQTAQTSISNWLPNTYTKHDLCRFFMSEAGFLSSTGILRASNGRQRAFPINLFNLVKTALNGISA